MSTHNMINQLTDRSCRLWSVRVLGGGVAGAVRRGIIDNFYLSTGLSWSPGWPWGVVLVAMQDWLLGRAVVNLPTQCSKCVV